MRSSQEEAEFRLQVLHFLSPPLGIGDIVQRYGFVQLCAIGLLNCGGIDFRWNAGVRKSILVGAEYHRSDASRKGERHPANPKTLGPFAN